jgi:hypothetical protein
MKVQYAIPYEKVQLPRKSNIFTAGMTFAVVRCYGWLEAQT